SPISQAPPDLQPFPTRRSSDLLHGSLALLDSEVWDDPGTEARHHPRHGAEPTQLAQRLPVCTAVRLSLPQVRCATTTIRCWRAGDRKSTRLNSSHGSISYAVFC